MNNFTQSAARNAQLCALLCLSVACRAFGTDWVELSGCRLVENQSNDGDSFVIECSVPYRGETQNRFRLYFVDTPETDANSDFKRDRLQEQAQYWESDDADFALQMGLRAEQSVKQRMRSGCTVYTRGDYAPSMGAPRYYAMIRVQDRWLDEWLVEEGLARIYGQGAHLPDGTNANTHRSRLRKLENEARSGRRNGWRYAQRAEQAVPEVSVFAPHDAVTTRDAWIYSVTDGRKVMVIPKGTAVSVMAEEKGTRLRIRFQKDGSVFEALIEKNNLN